MNMHGWRWCRGVITASLAGVMVAEVSAQPHGPRAAASKRQAVDQAVEDVDPLAVSQRYIQPGLAQTPQDTRVFVRKPLIWGAAGDLNLQQKYEYRDQGVHALIDRPVYLVRREGGETAYNEQPREDGEFKETVPANTVFNLIPQTDAAPIETPVHTSPYRVDLRLNLRLDAGNQRPVPYAQPHRLPGNYSEPQPVLRPEVAARFNAKPVVAELMETVETPDAADGISSAPESID